MQEAGQGVRNGHVRNLRTFLFPTARQPILQCDRGKAREEWDGVPRLKSQAPPDHKNSPSRFRFRPPLPLTFPFRVLPSDSVSTYLRSVLGASSTLTRAPSGSRDRKRTCPQFAEVSFFNISTAFLPTCGQGCGDDLRARIRGVRRTLQAGNTTRTVSVDSSRSTA